MINARPCHGSPLLPLLIVHAVAIISSIMIMMVIRSILAFFLRNLGVTLVSYFMYDRL
jgi:hypothetical protein